LKSTHLLRRSATISAPIHFAQIGQITTMMNMITNAHICLLNDFMRFALSSIRSVAELSPETIKKLEDSRDQFQSHRDQHFGSLLLMTKLVAWGVILEGPELAYETWNVVKRWRKRRATEHAPFLITLIGLIGWVLVSAGVAGEFWADSNVLDSAKFSAGIRCACWPCGGWIVRWPSRSSGPRASS
jgi:hypothetical protein